MGLRELRRSGGYLSQSPPVGQWVRYPPGMLARCPVCGTGLTQADAYSVTEVRVAWTGLGEPGEPSGFTLCSDTRCKARLQIRYVPAERNPNTVSDHLTLRP